MSSLTPFEEIAVRNRPSQVTLTGKQAESQTLQAQVDEFLASGGWIEQAVCVPFVPKFEITPEGKPKPLVDKSMFLADSAAKTLKPLRCGGNRRLAQRLEDVMQVMLVAGHPVTVLQIGKAIEVSFNTANSYIGRLQEFGCIRLAGKLGNVKLYEVVK